MLDNIQPDRPGEFVILTDDKLGMANEAVWAYIPNGYEVVVLRKEPGSLGVRETVIENQFADYPTIGIKFVKKEH